MSPKPENPDTGPGIYVARPIRADYVPVTRDPRYEATCARVNNANVKVGKAKNLAARRSNYMKDFDADNIEFIPLARTDEIQAAETAVLRRLKAFRKLSPKGGRMDWLENISLDVVVRTVYEVLDEERISYVATRADDA